MNTLASYIHFICSVLIVMQTICVINRMTKTTPLVTRLVWIGLSVGAFSNALIPPGQPVMGHLLLLVSFTVFILKPAFILFFVTGKSKYPSILESKHEDHLHG